MSLKHEHWMQKALDLATKADELGEVPVGAVIVRNEEIIGEGYNQPISTNDPSAHAEIVALRVAAAKEENYRLPGTILYVTIEPCTMCVGALIHARIDTVVFGAREQKAGALVSNMHLHEAEFFNHQLKVEEGILAELCSELISGFFQDRRK